METVCGNDTFVRVADEPSNRSGGYYGSYFMEGCNATVVPVIGGYGNANASNYKELIADGFLLTWNLPALPPLPQLPGNFFFLKRISMPSSAIDQWPPNPEYNWVPPSIIITKLTPPEKHCHLTSNAVSLDAYLISTVYTDKLFSK